MKIHGLRDILEDPSDDEQEQPNSTLAPADGPDNSSSNSMLFGHGNTSTIQLAPQLLTQLPNDQILAVYRERVDFIFKVLHWPTVLLQLAERSSDVSVQALERCIHFAAMCTLTESEVSELLSEDKESLVRQYRLAAETSLSRANLLSSANLVTLQAFVIYLVSALAELPLPTGPEISSH